MTPTNKKNTLQNIFVTTSTTMSTSSTGPKNVRTKILQTQFLYDESNVDDWWLRSSNVDRSERSASAGRNSSCNWTKNNYSITNCNAAPCHPSPTPLILNILAVFFIKHFVQSRTRLEEAAPHGYGWAAPLAADFFRPCVVKSRRKRGGLVL